MTREEAANMIRNDIKLHHDYLSGTYRSALNMAIQALIEPEVKHGHWIIEIDSGAPDGRRIVCSECKEDVTSEIRTIGLKFPDLSPLWDYCPYCGTKMGEN